MSDFRPRITVAAVRAAFRKRLQELKRAKKGRIYSAERQTIGKARRFLSRHRKKDGFILEDLFRDTLTFVSKKCGVRLDESNQPSNSR